MSTSKVVILAVLSMALSSGTPSIAAEHPAGEGQDLTFDSKPDQFRCLLDALDALASAQEAEAVFTTFLRCSQDVPNSTERDIANQITSLALISYYSAWPQKAEDKGFDAAFDDMFWLCFEHLATLEDEKLARIRVQIVIAAIDPEAGIFMAMHYILRDRFPKLLPLRGQPDATALSQALAEAPAWSRMPFEGPEAEKLRKQLIDVLEEVARLPPAEARKVLEKYLLSPAYRDDQIDGDSKIFIFNRIYFAVPEWMDKSEAKYFGGWGSIPESEDGHRIKMMWPVEVTEHGSAKITSAFGGFFGPTYEALREFDYLHSTYGPRNP